MTVQTIKSNDDAITFTDTLLVNGAAKDLTGCTVLFLLKMDGATVFSASATIVTAASGTVSYAVSAGFPTTPGLYKQEWQVTQSNSKILTFPSDGYNNVQILDDLN